MAFVGFAGCDRIGSEEYGTPNADYEFSGKVTGEQGEAVPHIRIKVTQGDPRGGYAPGIDSARTDADGMYKITFNHYPSESFSFVATDVDGALNGSYRSDTTTVEVTDKDFDPKRTGWYAGVAKKEVNITLKEREFDIRSPDKADLTHLMKRASFIR
jgi:putative lipoprotein (rSAM/lipoprotein system)